MSLLSRLLGRRMSQNSRHEPAHVHALPEGPLYAIGDIHGHALHLANLEDAILADAHAHGETHARIVTLGDYVDRGPDSAGVLDRLLAPPPEGIERFCLKGNHEAMFEDFLDAPDPRAPWLQMGGTQTLASYGLYLDRLAGAAHHFRSSVHAMIPDEHRTFLHDLPLAASTSTHFLCHAGVDPSQPLDAQTAKSLLWIRTPFLEHQTPLSRIIVHGHTPVSAPDLRGWRINVDTGAYAGGPLSAVRLDGSTPPQIVQVN